MSEDYLNKIIKVISSCETLDQLDIAYAWGMDIVAIDDYNAHLLMWDSQKEVRRRINHQGS